MNDSEDGDFIPGGFEVRKMASKQTYECYVCKRNGFADTRVYLDGKTEDGRTIYKNEDMSPHQHKRQQQHGSDDAGNITELSETTQLKVLGARLEYAISLLETLQPLETRHIDRDG